MLFVFVCSETSSVTLKPDAFETALVIIFCPMKKPVARAHFAGGQRQTI